MTNHNTPTREELRQQLMQALRDNNQESFAGVFDQMLESIGEGIRTEYEQELNGLREELDTRVLTARLPPAHERREEVLPGTRCRHEGEGRETGHNEPRRRHAGDHYRLRL